MDDELLKIITVLNRIWRKSLSSKYRDRLTVKDQADEFNAMLSLDKWLTYKGFQEREAFPSLTSIKRGKN